jgi:hypothetical protein
MGEDRPCTLTRSHPMTTSLDGPRLELGESVSVVEESRLREVEAERDTERKMANALSADVTNFATRLGRAEAELREAREALRDLLATETESSGITPAECGRAWSRARGVLENGAQQADEG